MCLPGQITQGFSMLIGMLENPLDTRYKIQLRSLTLNDNVSLHMKLKNMLAWNIEPCWYRVFVTWLSQISSFLCYSEWITKVLCLLLGTFLSYAERVNKPFVRTRKYTWSAYIEFHLRIFSSNVPTGVCRTVCKPRWYREMEWRAMLEV